MDLESPSAPGSIQMTEVPIRSDDSPVQESEEPYSLNATSVALLGLFIAIATIGIPLAAVFTDRPLESSNLVSTALEFYGLETSRTISIKGIS